MFGNWTFGTLVFTVMVITVTLKVSDVFQSKTNKPISEEAAILIDCSSVMAVGARDTLLDVDEPFCHVGIHCFLLHILLVLWRNYMVLQQFILPQHTHLNGSKICPLIYLFIYYN